MNLRELIEELQKKYDEYGEVPITAWDGNILSDVYDVQTDVYTEAEGVNVELQLRRFDT